jgi:SAM-dependent methyltransferase
LTKIRYTVGSAPTDVHSPTTDIPAAAEKSDRFDLAQPQRPRRARLGSPLAYIIWRLPRRLRALTEMLSVQTGGRVLDYGCAEQPYRNLFGSDVHFVGADLPGNPLADVVLSADGTVPLDGECFDAILSTQVLEHVADPGVYLAECARLLKPGGRLLLSTHGLMVYHPDPEDYWRWTSSGLVRAVEAAGLSVKHTEGIMGLVAVGLQFIQDGVYFRIPRRARPVLAAVFQALIVASERLDTSTMPNRNALIHVVIAEKPSPAERA